MRLLAAVSVLAIAAGSLSTGCGPPERSLRWAVTEWAHAARTLEEAHPGWLLQAMDGDPSQIDEYARVLARSPLTEAEFTEMTQRILAQIPSLTAAEHRLIEPREVDALGHWIARDEAGTRTFLARYGLLLPIDP